MPNKQDNYDSSEILKILKNTVMMTDGFSDYEINELADIAKVEIYDVDELILKEDDASRDLLIVGFGNVSVEMNVSHDKNYSVQIKRIRNYSVIGEFSFIDGSRRSANVKASLKTTVLRFPFDKLDSLCKSDLNIGYKLMKNLAVLMSNRLRNTNFELRSHLYL